MNRKISIKLLGLACILGAVFLGYGCTGHRIAETESGIERQKLAEYALGRAHFVRKSRERWYTR